MAGIRLVIEELRADVTRTRKDGSRGRLKIDDYGDPKEPEAAIKWLWKCLDRGVERGRALRPGVSGCRRRTVRRADGSPGKQRTYRMHWGSHKDIAAKALKKLASPHLPTSLKALERAVQRVHAGHRSAIEQLSKASPGDAEDESKTAVLEPDGDADAELDDETDERIDAAAQE